MNSFLSAVFFVVPFSLWGQQVRQTKLASWTTSPFNQKVFIENKGQFSCPNIPGEGKLEKDVARILFGGSIEGVDLYFTANGLTYKHDELVPMTEEEKAKQNPEELEESEAEGKTMMKSVPKYLSIEWMGANPEVEIMAEEPVSFYYTYSSTRLSASSSEGKNDNMYIKANAFKKIVYKNLYPNIDMQYIFPSDSSGIKYSFILHPGANPALIKMKYENVENISIDTSGNVVIKSSFGEFIDHAPKTFYADNHQTIPSEFFIKNNIVSFSLPLSFVSGLGERVIIDPWSTNPSFAGYNAAYDVNYDQDGNVYIYGSYNPFKLTKLNSSGAIQWVYNAMSDFGSFGGVYFYGDFAVDEVNGTSYLVEGIRVPNGARIVKVNTLGMPVDTFPGNPNFQEMWRVEYNRCIGKMVIAGGGHQGTSQGAILDTNFANIAPINVLSDFENFHDMVLLAIDNNSNSCYMATSHSSLYPANYDNVLVKCPIPNLIPLAFSSISGHKFSEVGSVTYINNIVTPFYPANGVNGMAVSPNWLYTYNSDSLKRWNKNTGALVAAIKVSSLPPVYLSGLIQVSWGGLTADECDNIYVGDIKSIKQYNSSLVFVNTFAMADTVYDIKLGTNNKLYACGKNFVTEINVSQNNTAITVTETAASCIACDGKASVSAISCGGDPAGFAYLWNTSPAQITQTATGLCPGNYMVTITTNCFQSFTGTVTVSNFVSTATVNTSPDVTIALGESTILSVSGGVSYSWNPATGLSCPTCQNPIAKPSATTVYYVTSTDADGCSHIESVTVFVIEDSLFIPNVFTPNGDGKNDFFRIIANGYKNFKVLIFNRWGEKVFESNDTFIQWDGRVFQSSKKVPDGTYYYILTVTDMKEISKTYKGFITLLR